ncbi:unnamed protein product [Candida verbasci]|uniref:DUF676 domain-containing protein n=1 Tax=Candida verbasci TaxID=1227364 RepID=A0A9W4XEF3_9ASCO|nr:unnamed protein product [Candida verbasci]
MADSTHLFVLIHGLWGSPNHMQTIERFLKESIDNSVTNTKISTLRPACFRFWKTYDGLELNSKKIITEIFYEIESLKQKNNLNVTRISFIGYSLGGLLSRYVIGLLYELDFFKSVEPVFFTTFATPHVGVHFYNDNIFDSMANFLGPYMFGKTGGQLFISDNGKILLNMANPESIFYKGLLLFKRHILLANIKNDRTVAFFTSFITEYSPFEELDEIKIKYIKNLPEARIANKLVRPKFVDLTRTEKLSIVDKDQFKGNKQEETPFVRKNRWAKILFIILLSTFLVPLWIPFVFTTSTMVSIYSFIKIKIHSIPEIESHWNRVKNFIYDNEPIDPEDYKMSEKQRERRLDLERHESFKGDTSHITENAMDNVLYAEERFMNKSRKPGTVEEDNNKSEDALIEEKLSILSTPTDKKLIDMNIQSNDEIIKDIQVLQDYKSFKLFTEDYKLPLDIGRLYIISNLNKIEWVKIPVFLDVWNSHDGIVSRRGPKTNPKGAATIGLWVSILRNYLKEEKEEMEKL